MFAVIALGEIDQGYAPPARLMELIQKRWSAWEYAAEILADTMPPSEAHEFLQRLYTDATGDQERQVFARLLNDVALREEAKRGAMTVDD